MSRTAAVLTVGTELTSGLRPDTNVTEIACALTETGHDVRVTTSVPDDIDTAEAELRRLIGLCELVIVTGGLGPTHDDITREAAARALGIDLIRDATSEARLEAVVAVHADARARGQVLRQADLLRGARVLEPSTGTAPGQIIDHEGGTLVLLPGPPAEMRPMLAEVLAGESHISRSLHLKCAGLTESDAQLKAQDALGKTPSVSLTVLGSPAEVEVVLRETGGDTAALASAGDAVAGALGDACYSRAGESLAEVVVRQAVSAGITLATAESCTGGMIAAAITGVPGASAVFLGSVVAYADEVKQDTLGVPVGVLADHGAVSAAVAVAMAEGISKSYGADFGLAVTGVAGPDGGTDSKPVGTVFIAIAGLGVPTRAVMHHLSGDRAGIRQRACVRSLDLVRRTLAEL